jgi:DNA-binding transcriptional regulator LsrR (DeoR family)
MSRKPKVDPELAEKIRWYYFNGNLSMVDIAHKFNLSPPTVGKVINKEGVYKT